jgi:pimeloyl-ACP methyl ester carboxylesterase
MLDSGVIPEPSGIHFRNIASTRLEILDLAARQPGLPELLLLHEGLGSVSMWRDFPAALATATGCRVVAYSRAGFGRSSPRTTPYTPRFMHEEAFDTIPALRESLGIARPVLIGHSTGASMALVHGGSDRRDVAGIVAMAPLVTLEPSNLESIREAREAYATTDWRAKLARHHDDVDAVFHGWNDTWLDPAFQGWSISADVAGVRAPILAILGEDDPYSTPRQLEAVAANALLSELVELMTLPGCGHAPHRERPEVVVPAIARFVDSVSARPGAPRFER